MKADVGIVQSVFDFAIREIIIDTMQRFLRAKDTNDYAEMTLLFDHVIQIAHLSKAALLLLTHNSKVAREGLDAILGSTAIAGSVDTAFLLTRGDRYRSICTVQRTGDDLGETILRMDDAGHVYLAGSRHLADQDHLRRQFIEVLEKADDPLRRSELLEQVEGRKTQKLAALKDLVSGRFSGTLGTRILTVTGAGTKTDPYLYSVRVPGFPPIGGNPNPSFPFDQEGQPLTSINGGSRIRTGPEPESDDSDDLVWLAYCVPDFTEMIGKSPNFGGTIRRPRQQRQLFTTGNMFCEVMSNAQTGRLGWGRTCTASWLLYFLTPSIVLVYAVPTLRAALPRWERRFPMRRARNEGYDTLGVCVPIRVAEDVAESVSHLDRGDGIVLQSRDSR